MNGVVCFSTPFTWLIKDLISQANAISDKKVIVGGPAVMLMKDKLQQELKSHVSIQNHIEGVEPITTHNPFATFTTRGCINTCSFCAVPKIEGEFREISDFVPRPIICDNNFLAASTAHKNKTIRKLKNIPLVDFNQGLDCSLFDEAACDLLSELKIPVLRFSFDHLSRETQLVEAVKIAKKRFKIISVYLLYGFFHTVEESEYMAEILRNLKVRIYPMRYQPLDCTARNQYVCEEKGWSQTLLSAFQRCYFATKVPFAEFKNQVSEIQPENYQGFPFWEGV